MGSKRLSIPIVEASRQKNRPPRTPARPVESGPGAPLEITNVTYESGELVVCTADNSIQTRGVFAVQNAADVTLIAPLIGFGDGFAVESGGELEVQ